MPAATSSHRSSGIAHPAGEPAAHPHDRHGSPAPGRTAAAGPPSRRPARRSAAAAANAGHARRGRVVEHQRGGQPQPGRRVQPVPQLHRGQRVEAQVPERPARPRTASGDGCPSTAAASPATRLGQHPVLLGLGQPRQPLRAARSPTRRPRGCRRGRVGAGSSGRRTSGTRSSSGLARRSVNTGANRAQSTSATVTRRLAAVQHLPQRRDRQLPASISRSPRRRSCCRALVPLGHPAAAPEPPRHRRRRPAPAPRGCSASASRYAFAAAYAALPAAAPGRRDRGEQHERVQIQARGQLVQVRRARRLGRQRPRPVRPRSSSSSGDVSAPARRRAPPRPAAARPRRSSPAARPPAARSRDVAGR